MISAQDWYAWNKECDSDAVIEAFEKEHKIPLNTMFSYRVTTCGVCGNQSSPVTAVLGFRTGIENTICLSCAKSIHFLLAKLTKEQS